MLGGIETTGDARHSPFLCAYRSHLQFDNCPAFTHGGARSVRWRLSPASTLAPLQTLPQS